MKKNIPILVVFLVMFSMSFSQEINDSIKNDSIKIIYSDNLKLNYKPLIIPTVLISYGIIGLESHQIQIFNSGIKEEVKEHIDEKISIDDFSQYLPFVTAFGLEAFGVKGKNKIKDKAIILTTSYLLMGLTVNAFKMTATVERPDGSSQNSFPSGHTATAFMGAELLYQEYKNVSVWYGISGYLVATGTGVFRMYNNRHWLTDVAAGAGIGILSTKAAYWLFPTINKLFTKKSSNSKTVFIPYYDGKTTGFGLVSKF
jgi:hypothetical protein